MTEDLSKVTRITVVTEDGRVFEKYDAYTGGVYLSVQDEGRTLKVFPSNPDTSKADWTHPASKFCTGVPKWVVNPYLEDVEAVRKYEWICDCRYQGLLDDI